MLHVRKYNQCRCCHPFLYQKRTLEVAQVSRSSTCHLTSRRPGEGVCHATVAFADARSSAEVLKVTSGVCRSRGRRCRKRALVRRWSRSLSKRALVWSRGGRLSIRALIGRRGRGTVGRGTVRAGLHSGTLQIAEVRRTGIGGAERPTNTRVALSGLHGASTTQATNVVERIRSRKVSESALVRLRGRGRSRITSRRGCLSKEMSQLRKGGEFLCNKHIVRIFPKATSEQD